MLAVLMIALTAFATLIAAAPTDTSAEAKQYLASAIALYEHLDYEEALDRLEKARKLSTSPKLDVTLYLYEALVLSDMGRREEASADFEKAFLLDPDAPLPIRVSPKVRRASDVIRDWARETRTTRQG